MKLPDPSDNYDPSRERQCNAELEKADRENHKRGRDVELGQKERVIMRSADGTRWALVVNNDGTLTTSAA